MKTLYAHQKKFLSRNPDNALLVWETGTGKTVAACGWLNLRKERKALVVCPKAIVGKWKRDLKEEGAIADVVTRDAVKVTDISTYKAIIIDEAQDFAAPLFDKQRSQRASKIYLHIKNHPDTHVLLLTATPVRSTPWNIHTLGCYLRHVWNVREFKNTFYYLTNIYGRMHYELVNGWQKNIRPYVEEIADIVLMKDCIDVPVQHESVIHSTSPKLPATDEYESASQKWYAEHKAEQVGKLEPLGELLNGYRKAIVVVNYTDQITSLSKMLGKDRQVFVLQGATKNADAVIEEAKAADDCVFIVQASMGAGFDASEFSVVIFASLSFRYVDYVQMKGRVKRINNLHENLFIHMLGGPKDQAIYNKIMQGKDFDVHHELM